MNRKRVVVTGGSGFLGSFVVEKLKQQDWVADIFVPRSREYDLREQPAVAQLYHDARPDIVIHLAGVVGGIGANRANPARFFYENLMMGVQLMHHAHLNRIEKFVAIGTICSYPKFTSIPFKEDDPYGLAKKMLLVQAQAYREQYRLNAIFLMPVNLYGPGDNFDPESAHVIPDLIRKCFEAQARGDQQIVLWGDGSPTREFLYVEDCAEGIVLATERYEKPEPVNIGAGFEISIKDLATQIATLTGFAGEIVWDASKPNGQPRRRLDTQRAEREFGFHARTDFAQGLRREIEWYRSAQSATAKARSSVASMI